MTLTEVRTGQYVKYRAGDVELTAYLSQPTTPGTHPGILIVQPVHGLTPHMEIVADRLAAQGYVAFAPALYSPLGTITFDASGPPPPEARELQRQTSDPDVVKYLQAAVTYMQNLDAVGDAKIGGVGFCAGGRWGLLFAAEEPRLDAFVAFYPTVADVEPQPHRPVLVWDVIHKVGCATCVLFGEQDHVANEEFRERLRALLVEHEVDYEWHLYAGAGHGFANEGSESYQDEPSRAAWVVADDYLARKLR
jgi:carboxymethylenebutenolidase